MTAPINLGPTIINLLVTRRTDNPLRFWIYEDGAAADLTGDVLTFVAKDVPGGTLKLNVACTLEDQTGALKGQATVTLPEAQLRDTGTPNDSVISTVEWSYEIRRTHAGLKSVPIKGSLTLGPTI